jgi:hypothetical protein
VFQGLSFIEPIGFFPLIPSSLLCRPVYNSPDKTSQFPHRRDDRRLFQFFPAQYASFMLCRLCYMR